MTKKVNVYIDWFNLYHSLANKIKNDRWDSYLKWSNLKSLVWSYLKEDEELNQVYFFSAIPRWWREKVKRHKNYSRALDSTWIKIINWNFAKISRSYKEQMRVIKFLLKEWIVDENIEQYIPKLLTYETFEEKKTDVNMAIKILEDAFKWNYDNAIILSWDSDIIPSIESVKKNFRNKKFYSLLITWAKWKAMNNICDENYIIWYTKFRDHLFPMDVELSWWTIASIPTDLWYLEN